MKWRQGCLVKSGLVLVVKLQRSWNSSFGLQYLVNTQIWDDFGLNCILRIDRGNRGEMHRQVNTAVLFLLKKRGLSISCNFLSISSSGCGVDQWSVAMATRGKWWVNLQGEGKDPVRWQRETRSIMPEIINVNTLSALSQVFFCQDSCRKLWTIKLQMQKLIDSSSLIIIFPMCILN